MDKKEQYEDDMLTRYMNRDLTEKASEGFAANVMTRVHLEASNININIKTQRRLITIPFISIVITSVLILATIFSNGETTLTLPASIKSYIPDIRIIFPELDFSSFFRINLPSILLYVLFGIIILSVFDKALNELFHKEKQ